MATSDITIPVDGREIAGTLHMPDAARGLVLFVHGSGSSRFSPRNQWVANFLNQQHIATLLMDLLTPDEERLDALSRELRFDIPLLSQRVGDALAWVLRQSRMKQLGLGLFGASTGAAAALVAAARHGRHIKAVVSRGGRPDLAGDALPVVTAPTLMIVGGNDPDVLDLNRQAMKNMTCRTHLHVVPGATHLFEEPGALEEVAQQATQWFTHYLADDNDAHRH